MTEVYRHCGHKGEDGTLSLKRSSRFRTLDSTMETKHLLWWVWALPVMGPKSKIKENWPVMLAVSSYLPKLVTLEWSIFCFNWRITALQYCVGLCHTSTWISHRYTYVPSLWNLPPTSHPSKFWQRPRFEFPESYSEFPLAVYFAHGNVCFQEQIY